MLHVERSEHHTGLQVAGTGEDLDALCGAVARLVLVEDVRNDNAAAAYLRGLCGELHRASRGEGAHLACGGSLHCAARLYWPVALFDLFALDDFMRLAEYPNSYLHVGHPALPEETRRRTLARWEETVALLRFFESLVLAQFRREIGARRYQKLFRTAQTVSLPPLVMDTADCCTPYLDLLTVKYLRVREDRRPVYLATVAGRLFTASCEHRDARAKVQALAVQQGVDPSAVVLEGPSFPTNVQW